MHNHYTLVFHISRITFALESELRSFTKKLENKEVMKSYMSVVYFALLLFFTLQLVL